MNIRKAHLLLLTALFLSSPAIAAHPVPPAPATHSQECPQDKDIHWTSQPIENEGWSHHIATTSEGSFHVIGSAKPEIHQIERGHEGKCWYKVRVGNGKVFHRVLR